MLLRHFLTSGSWRENKSQTMQAGSGRDFDVENCICWSTFIEIIISAQTCCCLGPIIHTVGSSLDLEDSGHVLHRAVSFPPDLHRLGHSDHQS